MPEELKPCPGCGQKPKLNSDTQNKWYWIECECGWEGSGDLGISGAIESWNTRPIEAALQGRIAELEAVIFPLLEYRDHNTLNFQLEKLDDYLLQLRELVRKPCLKA
jgi:hypothetical protein